MAAKAIKQDCVQELAVVMAPKLLGGEPAMTALADLGFTSMNEVLHTSNGDIQKLGKDWLFRNLVLNQKF